MPLVNCKISLILTWLGNRVITDSKTTGTFEIIDTKLYVPVVTLSIQDNTKLLQRFKSRFNRTVQLN